MTTTGSCCSQNGLGGLMDNILQALVHELMHHIAGQAHSDEFWRRMDCFQFDSGW